MKGPMLLGRAGGQRSQFFLVIPSNKHHTDLNTDYHLYVNSSKEICSSGKKLCLQAYHRTLLQTGHLLGDQELYVCSLKRTSLGKVNTFSLPLLIHILLWCFPGLVTLFEHNHTILPSEGKHLKEERDGLNTSELTFFKNNKLLMNQNIRKYITLYFLLLTILTFSWQPKNYIIAFFSWGTFLWK